MTALNCPSRGFQDVYLRRATGGYYTRARFPVQPKKTDHELINGKPSFLLAPVFRLFRINERNLADHQEILEFPRPGNRVRVSVGKEEIELYFDLLPAYRAVQNSNLEVLLEEYDRESSEPNVKPNPRGLARAAHRYAATMGDGQDRCLLELMARVLEEAFPKKDAQDPLAENEVDVLK